MNELYMQIWNDFFNDTLDDAKDIEGIIWQKSDGKWMMLVGDPQQIGRIMTIQINYNPFTGERLER